MRRLGFASAGLWAAGALLCSGALHAAPPADPVGWGKPVDGLQVGIFRIGRGAVDYGGQITFAMKARNAGTTAIGMKIRGSSMPSFCLAAGNRIIIQSLMGDGVDLRLAPGQEAELPGASYRVRIVPPGEAAGGADGDSAVFALQPGRYVVECPMPVWMVDKDDPNRATGHRARAGTMAFTVSGTVLRPGPAAPDAPEIGPIQWGEINNGLQSGVAVSRTKPADASVSADIFVRNRTSRALSVTYPSFGEYDWYPMVNDAQGNAVPVGQVFVGGMRGFSHATIEPGKTIRIGHAALVFRPAGAATDSREMLPSIAVAPGRYTAQYVAYVRFAGLDRLDVNLVTGKVEFDVPKLPRPDLEHTTGDDPRL